MTPLELAAYITILVLVCIGIAAAVYVRCTRQRKKHAEQSKVDGLVVKRTSKSLCRIKPAAPLLPLFKTRSSLSMSSSPTTPHTPRSPGIRFAITPPSRRSRKSGSIDSLPSVETVLEQYEKEAEAAEGLERREHGKMSKEDGDLGEPGPSVIEEKPLTERTSVWDRPGIAEKAAR